MVSQRRAATPSERKQPNAVAEVGANDPATVRLALRRRQRIVLLHDVPEHIFELEDGCLTLDAILPNNRRQVMLVLYPGDLITRSAAPLVPQLGLTALRPSLVVRTRDGNHGIHHDRQAAFASLAARSGLHGMAIGRLTGEERLATLMIEMALRLGQVTPGGRSFEMPLSRVDMADYLALNPDTLSRLMSRMRSRGILLMPSRSRVIIRDFATLAALTPLADALQQMCPPATLLPLSASKAENPAL